MRRCQHAFKQPASCLGHPVHLGLRCHARLRAGAAGLPREERLRRFKQLLLEGGVNGFSFYAKVKPKLDKDER